MPDEDGPGGDVPDVEAQVWALGDMNLKELRTVWQSRWGRVPKLRSVDLLRRIIAWRMQADAEGGLRPETRIRLRPCAARQAGSWA